MSTASAGPHPAVWGLLIVPFGAVSGFVGVAIAFNGGRAGLSPVETAALVATGSLPHTVKFLWGPVADTTLSRQRWYLLSCLACIAGLVTITAVPLGRATYTLLQAVILVANFAATFLGMSVEGLMAHLTPPDRRGATSGWFQAGNLGGYGIGGGLGAWLIEVLPAPWMTGALLGAAFLVGLVVSRTLPDVAAEARDRPLPQAIGATLVDLWSTVRSRPGLLSAILCFLPIGTGAAAGVLAQEEIAAKWGAGLAEVATVNGVLSGVISAVGCLAGGWVCQRFPPRAAYAGIGALMAAVAAAMALGPRDPTAYVGFGLAYAFVTGLSFAAFTAFVLDAIGAGAAATKYNVFASLSNIPIAYMGVVLAGAYASHGESGLLYVEAGAAVAGIVALAAFTAILMPRRR